MEDDPAMNSFDLNSFLGKKKVLLRAPVLTQSGYGVHSRQIAKWLLSRPDVDLEVQALAWGETPWLINPELCDGLIGKLMEKTVDPKGRQYDATVQVQLPNEWDTSFSKVNIGITAGVETNKCNPAWVSACNSMTLVIVPSKHSESSLRAGGEVKTPVAVIPEAYTESIDRKDVTAVDSIELSTPFNFLLFGQITGNSPENERKNLFYTVKWLCETFKNDKDVGIVVKTNAGRNTSVDRKVVSQLFTTLLKEVRKGPYPALYLLHGDMSDNEVASLYRHPKIKALVSLTRGEGYGLPILEAAASGLPVVTTKWSGHMDFMSLGKFTGIDYKLIPVHQSRIDNQIFMQGSMWAQADEQDFKRKIARFRETSIIPGDWAKDLKTTILKKYSIESIVRQYNEVTKDLI